MIKPQTGSKVENPAGLRNDLNDPTLEREYEFRKWLLNHGIDVDNSKIGLANFASVGRGTIALKPIQFGDTILKIPKRVILTRFSAVEHSPLKPILEQEEIAKDTFGGLVIALMFESENPNSYWRAFLDLLPSSFDTPLYWSQSDLETIINTPLYKQTISLKSSLKNFYKKAIEPLIPKFTFESFAPQFSIEDKEKFELLKKRCCSYDKFLWSISTMWNRAYWLDHETEPYPGIVPFADMLNHSDKRGKSPDVKGIADYRYNDQEGFFEVKSCIEYEPGEQVFTCYGTKDQTALLADYGFFMEDEYMESDNLTVHIDISTAYDIAQYFKRDVEDSANSEDLKDLSITSTTPIISDTKSVITEQSEYVEMKCAESDVPKDVDSNPNETLNSSENQLQEQQVEEEEDLDEDALRRKLMKLLKFEGDKVELFVTLQVSIHFPKQLLALCRMIFMNKEQLKWIIKDDYRQLLREEPLDWLSESHVCAAAICVMDAQPGIDNPIDPLANMDMDRLKISNYHKWIGHKYNHCHWKGIRAVRSFLEQRFQTLDKA